MLWFVHKQTKIWYCQDAYSLLAREKYPDDWEERELDGEVLYEASGGIPHGRLSIADGAVKKASIIPSARQRSVRASNSLTLREKEQLRRATEENALLKRTNEMLQQKQEMHGQLIIVCTHSCTYLKISRSQKLIVLMFLPFFADTFQGDRKRGTSAYTRPPNWSATSK
jgi:hypothetical protein